MQTPTPSCSSRPASSVASPPSRCARRSVGRVERLRRLDRDQSVAVDGRADPIALHTFQGVRNRERRDGARRTRSDCIDHGVEQCGVRQGSNRIVHDDDRRIVGHRVETGAHRRRPSGSTGYDQVGTEAGCLRRTTAGERVLCGNHQHRAVGRGTRHGEGPRRDRTPTEVVELLHPTEAVAGPARHHDGPDRTRSAQGSASLRRSSAVSSSTPRAKVNSETRIWRARLSIRFSPAERPLSLSRIERFRTTSATW